MKVDLQHIDIHYYKCNGDDMVDLKYRGKIVCQYYVNGGYIISLGVPHIIKTIETIEKSYLENDIEKTIMDFAKRLIKIIKDDEGVGGVI